MFRITILLAALTCAAEIPAQSLWARANRKGQTKGLVDDFTAGSIGDILTIVIREQHKVKQEDKLDRSTTTSLAASLESFNLRPSLFRNNLLPDIDVRSSRQHQGQARQEKDSNFEARVAVTVIDRLPNGNLIVSGRRTVFIEDETKTLKLSGVIRKVDIAADNTITSDKVAEAKVSILGTGKNTEATTRGPVGKIIETAWWLIWPF